MKQRPILFSGPMVRALLAGTKTQTRRIVKPQSAVLTPEMCTRMLVRPLPEKSKPVIPCPYGQPGDALYVREEYFQRGHWGPVEGARTKGGRQKWSFIPADEIVRFDAPESYRKGRHASDPQTIAWHSRRARFMPRALSRITLEITDIRVERLRDINAHDALAEGVGHNGMGNPIIDYQNLWESINGPGSWDVNPWVWVVEFRKVES